MQGDFGECDLTPDQAKEFITDLTNYMDGMAHYEKLEDGVHVNDGQGSPAKDMYGDQWLLLFGITNGMRKVAEGKELKRDADADYIFEADDSEITYDLYYWNEHHGEYGYGKYGKGLKIGKRLFFYEDRGFEFSEPEDNEPTFDLSANP